MKLNRLLFGGGPPVTETSQTQSFSRRAFVLGTAQTGVAVLLAARMGYIAIAENERYRGLAESNRVQTRLIPPRRGWIVDRYGQPMAINRADVRVDLIPDFIEDRDKLLADLARLLALPPEELQRIRTELDRGQGFQPVPVAEHLNAQQYNSIKVHEPDLPGVSVLEGYARAYPEGAAVGHLLGYVGTPNRRDYDAENRNPLLITPGYKVGKEGLEKVLEQRLRGRPGQARVEVTARGQLVRQLRTLPDVSGTPLHTTIDAGLQSYAARRLGEESGSCIILDCTSGDVLCMASMPAYDPNAFSDGISHSEWDMLSQDPRHPLINKTLNALYPPGSTFKPAVAMALMEAGVDPDETINCPGGYQLGSRRFGCLGTHGPMNLHRAIARSCNTYFYTMGRRIGIERFSAMAKRLGLGQRFNDLPVVSQSYGTIPDPAWKQRRYHQEWSQADTLNAAIGQGYVILNPLQLAIMASRVASGRDIQPRLLLERRPQPAPLPFAAASFEAVRSGMDEVVNGAGTAGASRLPFPDIRMAGKTGTAQVRNIVDASRGRAGAAWRYRDHGLFVFFAPVGAPRYAGAVVIEHGLGGARAAAPVACDVMTYLFDKDRAMERLRAHEAGWGGTLAERTARRAALWANRRPGDPPPDAADPRLMALAFFPRPIAELPWRMLIPVIAIAAFSLLVLYSAAGGDLRYAKPQGIRFVIFFGLAILLSRIRPEWLKQATFPAYVIILGLLMVVEALGFVGGGAQRWVDLGPINLQPSELMKPVVVLACAHFYAMLPAREIRGWSALWPPAVLIGLPAGLVLIQPDLGTASMLVFGGITVMFLAGVPLRLFAGGVAFLAVALPIAFSFLHDYQQQRILIFMNPEADPLRTGYHITQSKIAIGSGGITGVGFLNGTQSHLDYLPEGHTDFVFATMAEEWGLLGGLFLIMAFALILRWGMRVAMDSRDRFSRLVAGGLTTTIFFYVAINLMMVMGLAPVVGIPLPLFSYGGSAMMTVMICLGILMAIERQNRRDMRRN